MTAALRLPDEALTREQRRALRKVRNLRARAVRSKTVYLNRISKAEQARWRALNPEAFEPSERPKTRGECGTARPCPFVSCKYHLYLDVRETGNVTFNFPDLEPHELKESCALDVADRGRMRHEDVGPLMNIVRERVAQVEKIALAVIEPQMARLK